MKKEMTARQVCFIIFAYGAATKLLLYPSAIAKSAGSDLLFSALINFALQTVMVWSVAFLSSRTDKTFFELISSSLGKVTARIVYGLFALYFLLSAIIPVSEQQLFVHNAFYDTIPALYVFLPFFFFSFYAGAKGFANVGRCADVCFPIFLTCVGGLLIMSLGQGDYTNLLPVLRQPFTKVAGASLSSLFRFSESAFLLLFIGRYNYRKGDCAKITLSYVAGGLIVMLLIAAYYAIYGKLTPSRAFLPSNISAFFPALNVLGRVDLVLVYALDVVILFATVLNVQACVHCACAAFNLKSSPLFSFIANTALIVVTFLANNKFTVLQEVAAKWFFIPALVFAYLVPVLVWALKRREK